MRTTCKNPDCPRKGKPFKPERAGAQYCSVRCRVAVHRARRKPVPGPLWLGKVTKMRAVRQTLADQLMGIARDGDGGKPKTGRRYYYLALSYGYISPDMGASDEAKAERAAAYKLSTDVLGTMRMSGQLDWDMVLDLTRSLDEWQTYGSARDARAAMRRSYDEDRWMGQTWFPILIVEKDTMEPVCKPMASRWQMPFASSRGYSSLRLQHDVAKLLRERRARTGQFGRIYFVSDHDPSGLDLQRAWEEALANFGAIATFVRVGLTIDQARNGRDEAGRPLEELSIGVKAGDGKRKGDSRALAYMEQYGPRCWEVDILPAETIEQAIDADIERWINWDLWRRREVEIESARALL